MHEHQGDSCTDGGSGLEAHGEDKRQNYASILRLFAEQVPTTKTKKSLTQSYPSLFTIAICFMVLTFVLADASSATYSIY